MKHLLFTLLLCGVPAIASAADPMVRDTSADSWIESQLVTTYQLNPHLEQYEIDATVRQGEVTLSGGVSEEVEKELAEQIAKSVSGVKSVDNEIVVREDTASIKKRDTNRTFGQTVADATTTARVKSKLLWNSQTSGLKINVDTANGGVTLSGSADSEAAKSLAGRLASRTPGVVAVQNQLVVDTGMRAAMTTKSESVDTASSDSKLGAVDLDKATKNLGSALSDVGDSISDTWITTKVKSTFGMTQGVDARDITVSVNDGSVTLTGTANSAAEKALAEELAKDIRGVKRVTNNITVATS